MGHCLSIAAVVAALLADGTVLAQAVTPPDEFVTTRHEIDVGGRSLRYTAHAGMLPLYVNDTGELMAQMFIVAYVADRRRGEPVRPVTFIWNGGPGSSSSQVHLVGFGPKGLATPPMYPQWLEDPPTEIVDRPDTWLVESDLVFVDPIGTGYSRATSEAYRDILYSTRGDIEAVAEMIRLYRTRFDAWDAPIFIAGESYGTTRAMGVAEALERRRTGIAGVILISGSYDAGQEDAPALRAALQVPMYTAAAHYHGRLAPELQALPLQAAIDTAAEWARRDYAPALERHESLAPAERTALLSDMERYTGVAAKFVDSDTLELEKDTFADQLLHDTGLELGRYDLRMTFPVRASGTNWSPMRDPSLAPMLDLMQGTFPPLVRYIRGTLGYKSDLLYRGPFGEAFHPGPLTDVTGGAFGDVSGVYSDWMSVMWDWDRDTTSTGEAAQQAQPAGRSPLERAMEMNPHFLVWSILGLYDISCAAREEAIARTPESFRRRVRASCYASGHMFYTESAVRRELRHDFSQFVSDALSARDTTR